MPGQPSPFRSQYWPAIITRRSFGWLHCDGELCRLRHQWGCILPKLLQQRQSLIAPASGARGFGDECGQGYAAQALVGMAGQCCGEIPQAGLWLADDALKSEQGGLQGIAVQLGTQANQLGRNLLPG